MRAAMLLFLLALAGCEARVHLESRPDCPSIRVENCNFYGEPCIAARNCCVDAGEIKPGETEWEAYYRRYPSLRR